MIFGKDTFGVVDWGFDLPAPPNSRKVGHGIPLIPRVVPADQRLRRLTEVVQDVINSLAGKGILVMDDPSSFHIGHRNYETDVLAPTVSDDETLDFGPGSLWIATQTPAIWICANAARGSAIWHQLV